MELPKVYNTYFLAIISTIGGMLYVSWDGSCSVLMASKIWVRHLLDERHHRHRPIP